MEPDGSHAFSRGDKATGKYLSQHAEKEADAARNLPLAAGPFAHALAIPAQAEGSALAHRLSQVPTGPKGPTLIVAVINAGVEASDEVTQSNQRSLAAIDAHFERIQSLAPHIHAHAHPSGQLIVINRSDSTPLPRKQGVGLARKIGCDFLLGAMESGRLTTPWIHCSDADTRLPADYFEQAVPHLGDKASALLYRFRHRPDPDQPSTHSMAQEYESSLRYYVLGLRSARSPHAFHSVGSALAIQAHSYAKVRGFPRKEAAEDFYILNKLAKLGTIQSLNGSPVEPSSRSSNRVPFGTGAAIQKRLSAPQDPLQVYHPRVFRYLQVWQAALTEQKTQPNPNRNLQSTVREKADARSEVEPHRLLEALKASEMLPRAERALQGPASTIAQAIRDNLDSFRTLKLIHALRDSGLGQVPLAQALDLAPFIALPENAEALGAHKVCARLEELDYA